MENREKMKKMFRFVSVFCVMFALVSCNEKPARISATHVVVEPLASKASEQMASLIEPYKLELDETMNVVVGHCAATLEVGRPESALSNFVCDAMLQKANEVMPTDFALTNIGGLRKPIAKGEVTLRTIYEVMPFDNQLVLLDLKGDDVLALCNAIAQVGGEGVSGISFGMENGKAVDVRIQGKPLDLKRTYRVATSDYLSFGNDKMKPLLRRVNIYNLEMQLRDLILSAFVSTPMVESVLDGRIYEK